jgi:hypothetical protein
VGVTPYPEASFEAMEREQALVVRIISIMQYKSTQMLTNKAHVTKVKVSHIIAEISNVLWQHEPRWK